MCYERPFTGVVEVLFTYISTVALLDCDENTILDWFKDSANLKDQDAHLAVGHAVEIIGKVDQNLAIKVQAATDFGTNIGT